MPSDVTTAGRLLLDSVVPEDMRKDLDVPLDKKGTSSFFQKLAQQHPEDYARVMHDMTGLADQVSTEYGRWTSVSLKDMRLPPRVQMFRETLQKRVHDITQNPRLTPEQKNEGIVKILRDSVGPAKKLLEEEGVKAGNAFAITSSKGIRGNATQLMQLLFGDVMVADNNGRPIPVPVLHGYAEGLTPIETFAGSYASRSGYTSVQFATADTGYFAKQLAHMNTGMQVLADDCGTTEGVKLSTEDAAAQGRYTNDGTLLTPDVLKKSRRDTVTVRSPLTCRLPHGVCQKCVGLRPDGKLPGINSFVSLDAARVTTEPMTQKLALSAKHIGGQVGVNDADAAGFEEIDQFVQVPETFRGATVTEVDGTVKSIEAAPQGGHYVTVGDETYHVPLGRQIQVKKGDAVSAGDALTDGTLNPADVARFRGIGEGRRYFVDKFEEILKKNGVGALRQNLELLARSYIQNVEITDPDGSSGYRFGEVLPYEALQQRWVPRPDAETLKPEHALNRYLEQPVAHFTIGTRITPTIAKAMADSGVDKVSAHRDAPGFRPRIVRAAARSGDEQDWKARLGGFYLKDAFKDMATVGAVDRPEGRPSAFAGVMDPSQLKDIQ